MWRWVNDDLGSVFCALKGSEKEKIEGIYRLWVSKRKKKKKETKKKKKHFLCFFFLFETHNLSNPSIFSFSNPSMHKTQSSNHHWLTFKYKSLSLFLFLFSLSYQCLSLRSMAISGGRFRWWVVIFVHLGLWVYGKFDFVFP